MPVTALDVYVMLDGHDRLVAAVEEEVVPDVVVLWHEEIESEEYPKWPEEAVRRYELAARNHARWGAGTVQRLNKALTRSYGFWRRMKNRARAVPDGQSRWEPEVRARVDAVNSNDKERALSDYLTTW